MVRCPLAALLSWQCGSLSQRHLLPVPHFPLVSGVKGLLGCGGHAVPWGPHPGWAGCRDLAQCRDPAQHTVSGTTPTWAQGLWHGWAGDGRGAEGCSSPSTAGSTCLSPPSPARLWAGQDETQVVGTSRGKRGWRGQGPCLRLGQHCPPLPALELLAAGRRPWRHVRPSVRRDQHWTLEPRSALDSPGEEGLAAPSLAGAGGWAAGGF